MSDIPTKHQHWVPKFYLAKFATPETRDAKKVDRRQISALNKQLELIVPKPTSVRNLCGDRYLYAPLEQNGERSMEVEKLLGRIETSVSGVWNRFAVERENLSDPELRGILAQFIATLHLRNKVILDLIASTMDLRDRLYGGPSKEILASRGPGGPDSTDPGRFFVHTLVNGIERITTFFSQKRWTILCADRDVFLTSDRPVTFLDRTGKGGPGKPEVPVIFPLSPRRILVMNGDSRRPTSDYVDLAEGGGFLFNSGIVGLCVNMALTGRPVDEVTRELSASAEMSRNR